MLSLCNFIHVCVSLFFRLEFFSWNEVPCDTRPEYQMDVPPTDKYKDIHYGMRDHVKKVTKETLLNYTSQFEKNISR